MFFTQALKLALIAATGGASSKNTNAGANHMAMHSGTERITNRTLAMSIPPTASPMPAATSPRATPVNAPTPTILAMISRMSSCAAAYSAPRMSRLPVFWLKPANRSPKPASWPSAMRWAAYSMPAAKIGVSNILARPPISGTADKASMMTIKASAISTHSTGSAMNDDQPRPSHVKIFPAGTARLSPRNTATGTGNLSMILPLFSGSPTGIDQESARKKANPRPNGMFRTCR